MGNLQNMLTAVLPGAWVSAMESESREWAMRCPCGHETSVWEMGGIRFKASGNPRRMGRCHACDRTFWGQVYRRDRFQQNEPLPVSRTDLAIIRHAGEADPMANTAKGAAQPVGPSSMLLWIDGVGCWSVIGRDQFTIGGPARPRNSSTPIDLPLMADLSSRHAVITRQGESYILEANGPAQLDSVPCTAPVALKNQQTIRLGESVQLRFAQPNALSASARIEFVSSHRPVRRIDGIVLMEQVCILGPTPDCHVVCPDWSGNLVLFRRDGRLCVKHTVDLFVNGCRAEADVPLRDGTVLSSGDVRLRVESERIG